VRDYCAGRFGFGIAQRRIVQFLQTFGYDTDLVVETTTKSMNMILQQLKKAWSVFSPLLPTTPHRQFGIDLLHPRSATHRVVLAQPPQTPQKGQWQQQKPRSHSLSPATEDEDDGAQGMLLDTDLVTVFGIPPATPAPRDVASGTPSSVTKVAAIAPFDEKPNMWGCSVGSVDDDSTLLFVDDGAVGAVGDGIFDSGLLGFPEWEQAMY
ncbi:hypothetical protein OAM67_01840, partial [bacterium]|nr:hypothetical protein [bacterium]